MFDRRDKAKKALELMQAYKAVFLSENGQAVLEDLAIKCHMLTPVTDVSGAATSAFYDGKRAAFDEKRLVTLLQQAERKNNE